MRTVVKATKYFLLSLAGCTIFYVVGSIFHLGLLSNLVIMLLEHIMARAFVMLICLGEIAIITESIRR